MRTFEIVSGPKTDDWLVRMVGALAVAIGLTLLFAIRRDPPSPETYLLAALAAAAFAAIDIVYVLAGRIRPIYLADAVLEIPLLLGAVTGLRRERPS